MNFLANPINVCFGFSSDCIENPRMIRTELNMLSCFFVDPSQHPHSADAPEGRD